VARSAPHLGPGRDDLIRTIAPYNRRMDLRIGVTQSPREVSVELADDTDVAALKQQVDAALTGAVDVLWLTDRKGRNIAVAAAKIAFVEIGSADSERKIGFGG
jgi:hypothetical protein